MQMVLFGSGPWYIGAYRLYVDDLELRLLIWVDRVRNFVLAGVRCACQAQTLRGVSHNIFSVSLSTGENLFSRVIAKQCI